MARGKRHFFEVFKGLFVQDGWVQVKSDPCMFVPHGKTGMRLAVVYVDDGIVAGPHKMVEAVFQQLQQHLEQCFFFSRNIG